MGTVTQEIDAAAYSQQPNRQLAPSSLPCCVRPVAQFLYFDMLRPGDGFVEAARKGGATFALLVGVALLFAVVTGFAFPGTYGTLAGIVYGFSAFCSGTTWISSYLLIRKSNLDSGTIMSGAVGLNLLTASSNIPANADYPIPLVVVFLVIMMGVMKLPYRWLWFAFAAAPFHAASYNWAAKANTFDFPPLLIDGGAPNIAVERRVGPWMVQYFVAVVIALFLYTMHDVYEQLLSRSRASAALSAQVSECLAVYDTERARDLLHAASTVFAGADDDAHTSSEHVHSSGVAGADEALVESLLAIVANLEAYRPHLPNWMLDDAARRINGAADEGSSVTSMPTTLDQSARDADASHSETGSNRSHRSDRSSSRRRPRTAPESHAEAAAPAAHVTSGTANSVRIARARLHFTIRAVASSRDRDLLSDDAGRRTALAESATAFVDCVHAAARSTKAAVHSFVGDTVEVTWNAASAAPAPAGKACRFMAQLMCDVAATKATATTVSGAAVAGKARVQLAGNGTQALLVSARRGTEQALTLLSNAAAVHRAMLCSPAVIEDVADIAVMPVATYVPDATCNGATAGQEERIARVYQVVGRTPVFANATGEPDGDWLYVLDPLAASRHLVGGYPSSDAAASSADALDRLTCAAAARAFRAIEAGDRAGALRAISDVDQELASASPGSLPVSASGLDERWPLVGRLRRVLMSADQRRQPSEAAASPTLVLGDDTCDGAAVEPSAATDARSAPEAQRAAVRDATFRALVL